MRQKSKVQEMFPVNRNIFWRGTYTHYMKSWLFLALIARLIAYAIGYASFDFKYIVLIVISLVIVVAVATKSLVDVLVDSYYFDITDDRVITAWGDIGPDYPGLSMPISDIEYVSVGRRWLEEMYYVKISSIRGGGSFLMRVVNGKKASRWNESFALEGFDEKTANAVKAYIVEKMGKAGKENHLPGQKSETQVVFAFDQDKFWRGGFLVHSIFCIGPIMIIVAILLRDGPLSIGDIIFIFVLIIVLVGLLIMAYFLANRFVNNYYFDVTDERIFISYPIFIATCYVALPLSLIKGVSIGPRKLTGSYPLKIVTHEPIFPGSKRRYFNYFEWGYFNEKTAQALKEYILAKSRRNVSEDGRR